MVRAYAWPMTVERLFRIMISAIRKQGFFKGLCARQPPCPSSATAMSSESGRHGGRTSRPQQGRDKDERRQVIIDWRHRYLASAVEAGRIVCSLRCGPSATGPSDTSHLERTR